MELDRASRTAERVAERRALHQLLDVPPVFVDPLALRFLRPEVAASIAADPGAHDSRVSRYLRAFLAARSRFAEDEVAKAVARGVSQYVIVGAGYDTFAYRNPFDGLRVFEVDHPATQDDKRAHVTELPEAIGNVSFVSMDFERESLDTVLERAGHDHAVPTCWIWEGVVMYLTREAMRATLAGVARRSARGSTLIVNYHEAHRRFVARVIFWLIGEPQISAWTPEEMSSDLRSAGFMVRDDSGMADWNARFAQGAARVERGAYMRVATARI